MRMNEYSWVGCLRLTITNDTWTSGMTWHLAGTETNPVSCVQRRTIGDHMLRTRRTARCLLHTLSFRTLTISSEWIIRWSKRILVRVEYSVEMLMPHFMKIRREARSMPAHKHLLAWVVFTTNWKWFECWEKGRLTRARIGGVVMASSKTLQLYKHNMFALPLSDAWAHGVLFSVNVIWSCPYWGHHTGTKWIHWPTFWN